MSSPDSSSYASDISDNGFVAESKERATYKCRYCPKSFSKIQALGGHQNAHKMEREIIKRQNRAVLAHMNQPYPNPYPYQHQVPNQYTSLPGFEQHCFNVARQNIPSMVYNQIPMSPSDDFARLRANPTQGMGRGWASTEISLGSAMAQPQPQPSFLAPPSVCLDLCLGIGSTSQARVQANKPKDLNNNKDDDLSLSLSLKL